MNNNFRTLVSAIMVKVNSLYYKNRTHWTEMVEMNATFDGDLTGREYYDAGNGFLLVKMSDDVLSEEDLIGSTMVMVINMGEGESVTETVITSEIIMKEPIDSNNYMIGVIHPTYQFPCVMIVHGDVSAAMGMAMPQGTYYAYMPDTGAEHFYTQSLSCISGVQEVVHKIDEKYLPDVGLKKNEVQTMIDDAVENDVQVMINDTVKNDVKDMIDDAIKGAIGGSY